MLGTVKWFGSKGQAYGYISRADGGEIFVHYRGILEEGQQDPKYKTLIAGQAVEFDEAPGHFCSGTQALNVKIIVNV
jgi:CspA family cold shock protein